MHAGLSLITLGVADVARARAFYERLGLRASGASGPQVAFFALNNVALALYDVERLREDAGLPVQGPVGAPSVALSQNQASARAVDAAMERALAAGATLLKAGAPTYWGGYAACFADPDGHVWELAFNPAFALLPDGSVELPP
jgi:catechol 2,3-dioxygenase-like lactoylglutathione lyase family enzyme